MGKTYLKSPCKDQAFITTAPGAAFSLKSSLARWNLIRHPGKSLRQARHGANVIKGVLTFAARDGLVLGRIIGRRATRDHAFHAVEVEALPSYEYSEL
jgi:hypothetical protein